MLTVAAIIAGATISGQGDGAFVSSGFVTALLGTGGVAGLIGYLGGRKHRVTVEPSISSTSWRTTTQNTRPS